VIVMMSESVPRKLHALRGSFNISEGIYFKEDAPTAISLRKNTLDGCRRRANCGTAQPVIGIEERKRVGQAYDVPPK
jgi:hypothetical protein